ncbi:MAG: HD domain-containing protein [Clostridia bacterium]|nr:HD domain-containing protein [Clostridia bacterium]
MSATNLAIDLNKFIYSVSLALDMAERSIFTDKQKRIRFNVPIHGFDATYHNYIGHSMKTALVAGYIASKLDPGTVNMQNLYIASYLHDIGAVHAFNISHYDSDFIKEHCDLGAVTIGSMHFDLELSHLVKYHHENYDGTGPYHLKGSEIPVSAGIIHLADYFDLMFKQDLPYRLQKDNILRIIRLERGGLFSPDAVDALLDAANSECFWLDIENVYSYPEIMEEIQPLRHSSYSLVNIRDIAGVFASIIDKKSKFTLEHSKGLAALAAKLSNYYGFDSEKTTMMEIAALLHDLGKLSVPNYILDKPGKLTSDEFAIIKSHTYYTRLILNKITGMKDIASWASNHHETLTGSGYPQNLDADDLCVESRIIAVCDIYQALTEDRPYRNRMSKLSAFGIMDSMVKAGEIDGQIVKALKDIV